MITQHWMIPTNDAGDEALQAVADVATAAALLRAGELVAFPTETVYGLGADALNAQAVAAIFAAKGRPMDNPLIAHVAAVGEARALACAWPAAAELLARAFWPGPMTLVVPAAAHIPREVTAGLDTVAIRLPAHAVARALIRATGRPLAAPSANRSGRPSPTRAEHVLEDLGGRIAGVLDGGPCGVGLESTVLDLSGAVPTILRPGAVTREMLAQALGQPVQGAPKPHEAEGDAAEVMRPRAPGMKYRHYAPRGELYLLAGDWAAQVDALRAALRRTDLPRPLVLLVSDESAAALTEAGALPAETHCLRLGAREQPAQLAVNLFHLLRRCDGLGARLILAETFAAVGAGAALMNRLHKAADGRTWPAQ
jgi:L-threonylcarbamoyladenylate synthase